MATLIQAKQLNQIYPPVESIAIELTWKEALAVAHLCGSVGGSSGWRTITSDVFQALGKALTPNNPENSPLVTGTPLFTLMDRDFNTKTLRSDSCHSDPALIAALHTHNNGGK